MTLRLESFPNEILWAILEYVPPIDLFHAFFNLNRRFNEILRLLHYRFNLLYAHEHLYSYYCQTILPNIEFYWIESFYIDDINDRLCSIHLFKQLQSLTICRLRTENIVTLANDILPELKQLNSLRLYSEFQLKEQDVNALINVIFSEKLNSLTYCNLGFQDHGFINFDALDSKHPSLSLERLVIDRWCRLRDFIRLLNFIPKITHLTVRLFDLNAKGPIPLSLRTIGDFTPLVPNLIYLRAKLAEISYEVATKILLLRLPTTLRELSLSTWSIGYGNGDSWEKLLSFRFPNLKHFRLIISLDRIPQNYAVENITDLNNIVKSFNQSKYFKDHNWNVLVNVNDFDRLKLVLHTVEYPIENFQTTLYDVRRCTASPSFIKSAYVNVNKLSLTLYDERTELSINAKEYRYFPNVEQLTFLSNLTSESPQYSVIQYFNNLKAMINLSAINYLSFPEENHHYPGILIDFLVKSLSKLKTLIIPYRFYENLPIQSMNSLKVLTLLFAAYSSISPPATRIRFLIRENQLLTNDIIVKLVQTCLTSFSEIQTLTFIVRGLDDFDTELSEWLKDYFANEKKISFELSPSDNTLHFYF